MTKIPAAIVALAGLALASAAAAQDSAAPAAAAPDVVVKAFSGYDHPDIGADACRSVDASTTECVIPAGTAGRYLIEGDGVSTAKDDKAAQGMVIGGAGWACPQVTAKSTAAKPWTSGPRTLKVGCLINVLADAPVTIRVVYGDSHATKDPKGPVVTIKRVPWNGVLDAQAAGAGVQ